MVMRGLQGERDGHSDTQSLDDFERALDDAVGQRRPLDEFEHERRDGAIVFKTVDLADVRMTEGCEQLRFPQKARETVVVNRDSARQDLQRHITIELCLTGPVDLAHAARAEERLNFVRTDARAGCQGHATAWASYAQTPR